MTGKSAVGNQTLTGEFQNDLSRINAVIGKYAVTTTAPVTADATASAPALVTEAWQHSSQPIPQKTRPPP
jgi:hypothetical protein